MRRACLGVLALTLVTASCTDRSLPDASVAIAGPTPVLPLPSLPTMVPGVLSIALPIEPGDASIAAFGITPFGYHGADHAEDGHTGWDIEYRVGASVRAAAAGTVLAVYPDASSVGRTTVELEHVVGAHFYRTIYTNIDRLAADVALRETVRAGQILGTAGTIGTGSVSYAMTHFQVDDFEFYREMSQPNAVSPEVFLSASAKAFFNGLWANASYRQELVEPFITNSRALRIPASRAWMKAGGEGPAGIRFTRRSASAAVEYDYALLADSGTPIESGTLTLSLTKPFASFDLVSATSRRLGIFDIVSNEMRLSLALPGAPRPTDLSSAAIYRTSAQ